MSEIVQNVREEEFSEFFKLLNDGHAPFSWQSELVRYILRTGRWPDRLEVPTGGGKSSVVDVHVFVNACSVSLGVRVPRRLSVVVNRRALVDSQADRAVEILERLVNVGPDSNELLSRVHRALVSLRATITEHELKPFEVGHLRGELVNSSLPIDDPTACAVIAATPDMWGSRLLFRGYGSSKLARPRETSILAMDSVLVLDEAHLNQQLLLSARRVAKLQSRELDASIPRLQVVETTATVAGGESASLEKIGVDLSASSMDKTDELLVKRLEASKKLVVYPVSGWRGKPATKSVVDAAVEEVHRLHQQYGSTIGCIVNHVETATNVAKLLKKLGLNVKVLVGRMRPADVSALKKDHPGLFTPRGDESVDVVVATQTLEVGIDANFRGLVTELAPGAAIVQRVGRLNRLGDFETSEAVIITPETTSEIKPEHPPYQGSDLVAAMEWLEKINDAENINYATIKDAPPPSESPKRDLLQRVEWADLELLSRTSQELFVEPDLGLWLRDSLEPEIAEGGIVVRENLPVDDAAAMGLLQGLPPRSEEAFPANLRVLNRIKEELVLSRNERFKAERRQEAAKNPIIYRVFLYRNNELSLLSLEERLLPGDILVIDRNLPFTTENVASDKPLDPQPPPEVPHPNVEVHVFSTSLPREEQRMFEVLATMTSEEATEEFSENENGAEFVLSSSVLELPGRNVVAWYLVSWETSDNVGEDQLQEWSPSQEKVSLEHHQRDVAELAQLMCQRLGLETGLAEAVTRAALHHDDGKIDTRFQRMLGAGDSKLPLAKSEKRTRSEVVLAKAMSGLPRGWRHEQLSALLGAIDELTPLEVKIIGSSHGHGRPNFPHVSSDLIETDNEIAERADELFTRGDWDLLVSRLHRSIGHYLLALLEAIERAADAQISKAGR
ncbi:type I-G CRISPR-associated helicase/endonuclease Cas3g [Corynebacterium glutamicum]|uniref:type I-G CRISPR-associated helicase/endonuclease Cas3g n=1 Tax=Corynebacterium glutamicum TaxID=1718 RepID=UPI0009C14510|nr:type I-U CRISPR-associated helicase/endonuclease Cas3 [Corynebacterium glutamicum]